MGSTDRNNRLLTGYLPAINRPIVVNTPHDPSSFTRLSPQLDVHVEDTLVSSFTRHVGMAPIMVQSDMCNLQGLSPAQLVKRKEDHNEMGGYFVINGNEKVVRLGC